MEWVWLMLNYNFIAVRFADGEWQSAAPRLTRMTFIPSDWERAGTEPELEVLFQKNKDTVVSYGKKDYVPLRIETIRKNGQNYPMDATEFVSELFGYVLSTYELDGQTIFPAEGIEDLGFFSRKNRWTELTDCLPDK